MSTHKESFDGLFAALRADSLCAVTWRVVNTADHGLPQNGPRVTSLACAGQPWLAKSVPSNGLVLA